MRPSAYTDGELCVIAEGVVCMLSPEPEIVARRDALSIRSGVAVGQQGWTALLETPEPDIEKGDLLQRSDGMAFRIEAVLWMRGSPVMQLLLKQAEVI